jgi:hypothetical protein
MVSRPSLAFALYHNTPLCRDRALLERVVTALADPRWIWPLDGYAVYPLGMLCKVPPDRSVRRTTRAAILDRLSTPDAYRGSFCERSYRHPAAVTFHVGQHAQDREGECPYWAFGHMGDLPPDTDPMPWVAWVRELAQMLSPMSGIISGWDGYDRAASDASLVGRNSCLRNPCLPEPFETQRIQASVHNTMIGSRRARHPRWGTFLHQSLVAQIGGVDAIESAVLPARIYEEGDLVFIQLTDWPFEPDEDKRLALERLMAPILLPP